MNTPFPNNEFRFSLPDNLRFSDSVREGYQATGETHAAIGRALTRKIADAIARMVTFARRGSTLAELRGMSDRELADMGLGRSDLPRVFDADFASEHGRRHR